MTPMRRGLMPASLRRPSAWLVAGCGLALYLALVAVIALTQPWPDLAVPAWLRWLAPLALYGALVACVARSAPPLRAIAAALILWAIHTGLAAATAGVTGAFVPSQVAPILLVGALLVPFRDLVSAARRRESRAQAPAPPRAPAEARSPLPSPIGPAGSGKAKEVAPSEKPAVASAGPRTTSAVGMPASPPRDGGPDKPAARPRRESTPESAPAKAPAEAPVSASQRALDTMLAESSAQMVRISFGRVVSQIPAAALQHPADRVAAGLREPGYLLVSQRLVLAQIADGVVRARWDSMAEQFPRELLAMTDEEITRALPDGQIVLPLDEIFPQLPRALFDSAPPSVDIEGIESFPAPFRPAPVPEPSRISGDVPIGAKPVPPEAIEPPAPEPEASQVMAPGAELALAAEPEVELGQMARVLEPVAAEPRTAPASEEPVTVEPAPDGDGMRASALAPSESFPGRLLEEEPDAAEPHAAETAIPLEAGPASAPDGTALERSRIEPSVVASGASDRAALREIAAGLAPIGPIEVGVSRLEGISVFTALPGGGARDEVVGVALLMLSLLDRRYAGPAKQLTLRGPDGTLIVTPIGQDRGACLMTGVTAGSRLALAELLSLRVAGTLPGDSPGRSDGGEPSRSADLEPELLETEAPTRVRQAARSLSAFGSVSASALRDADGSGALYLFLPATSDARAVAAHASEIRAAMGIAAGRGLAFHTATLRSAGRRLIVRLDDAPAGGQRIVVAGGETARPGLAHRQVEAVAALLGGR